jgi:hypothetical protein
MDTVGLSETSVNIYQTSRRNISQDSVTAVRDADTS